MERKSFEMMARPSARSLERVGEWRSMLILRDAFAGLTRFDESQRNLGIAPTMLSRRRAALVQAGRLERRRHSVRPPRDEYVLTGRGRDPRNVLMSLLAFGNRHFATEGGGARIVDAGTGAPADPVLADRRAGRRLAGPDCTIAAGPAVAAAISASLVRRYAAASPPKGHSA